MVFTLFELLVVINPALANTRLGIYQCPTASEAREP